MYRHKKLSIAEMKAANAAAGRYWFSRKTMKAWGTVIEAQPNRFNLFITSENFMHGQRVHSVRYYNPVNAHVETIAAAKPKDAARFIRAQVTSALKHIGAREMVVLDNLATVTEREGGRIIRFEASSDKDGHSDTFDVDLVDGVICG